MSLLNGLGRRRDTIRSPLTPQACAKDISAGVDGTLGLFGHMPVIGQVGARGGWLRKRIGYRNSFQTVMRLTIEETASGSRILVCSAMPIFATIFMAFWFAMIGVALLSSFGAYGGGLAGAAMPLGMIAFGVGLVAFCRWLARDEYDFLLAFVRGQVDGEAETAPRARFGAPIVR